jgi:subtilisin family serine protease
LSICDLRAQLLLTPCLLQADIITASIGGTNGFSTNAWGVIASRIVDSGVVVTIAAGNEGINGPFFGSNGALGPHVIAVASTQAREMPAEPFKMTFSLEGETNTSTYAFLPSEDPWNAKDLPIVPVSSFASENDNACEPMNDDAPDMSGKIALVRPGGCYNYIKQLNLEAIGAQHVLLYNTNGPFTRASSWLSEPSLGIIEEAAGEAIISTFKSGGSVTADFSKHPSWRLGAYNSAGGLPSPYTTWGGSFEGDVKPDVAAPGGYIYSTFPTDSWAVLSGTSMATPYVAGIAALWVGKFGGRNAHGPEWARQLSNRIISSGGSVPWYTVAVEEEDPIDYGYWAPVIQVGTGQVDAWKVVNYTTSLTFDNIALNDTHTFSRYHKVQIKNTGEKEATYKFALQPAGGIEAQS